jgi:hypothetical protein
MANTINARITSGITAARPAERTCAIIDRSR